MRSLRRYWIIPALLMVLPSCDDTSPTPDDPVISETLDDVAEILTGEGSREDDSTAEPNPEPVEGEESTLPTAKPVPDKPGFVISPFNGKWIDVTGIPPGTLVIDPDFPAEEKKFFIVPEPLPVEPQETPASEEDGTQTEGAGEQAPGREEV